MQDWKICFRDKDYIFFKILPMKAWNPMADSAWIGPNWLYFLAGEFYALFDKILKKCFLIPIAILCHSEPRGSQIKLQNHSKRLFQDWSPCFRGSNYSILNHIESTFRAAQPTRQTQSESARLPSRWILCHWKKFSLPVKHTLESCKGLFEWFCKFIQNPLGALLLS